MNPRSRTLARPDLVWIHDGLRHRATVWPEPRFEREIAPGEWQEVELTEPALASAAQGLGAAAWGRFLDFAPAAERELIEAFRFSRPAALQVAVKCPTLVGETIATPALVPFVAAHQALRGSAEPGWNELAAVYERDGVFGTLQWLGLPASRQTLAILRNVADPDLPRWLLEPLRAALWEPEAIWVLAHERQLTDARLAAACHALAA